MSEALKAANLTRWNKAKILPGRRAGLEKTASALIGHKARYQKVETGCGVPWWFVAVVHIREADGDFNTQLAQGDPLGRVSTHVPAGRGPFFDHPDEEYGAWERACFDALIDCAPHAAKNLDRSLAGWLLYFELYNGLGYASKGLPSPYLWSGTDQYERGKYVADGVFDANAVDSQPGCAALLKVMMEMDATIMPDAPVPIPAPTVPAPPTKVPSVTAPTLPTLPAGLNLASPILSLVAGLLPPPFNAAAGVILPVLPRILPALPLLVKMVELDAKIAQQVAAASNFSSKWAVLVANLPAAEELLVEIATAVGDVPDPAHAAGGTPPSPLPSTPGLPDLIQWINSQKPPEWAVQLLNQLFAQKP